VYTLKMGIEIHAIKIPIDSSLLAEIGLNHDGSCFLFQCVFVISRVSISLVEGMD
jgi:hypothetical protein